MPRKNKKSWARGSTDCDCVGNNAAFTCPHCKRVCIVSAKQHLHPTPMTYPGAKPNSPPRDRWFDGKRECDCGKSTFEVHVSPEGYAPTKPGDPPVQQSAWMEYD